MPHGNIWHWVLWLASLLFAYLTIAQGKMARRAHTCEHNERRETDVTCRDCNGKEVTIGSIVEILPWSSDRYRGLYYVVEGTQVPFDNARFKPGDEVASYLVYSLKGDRADIKVATTWRNGVHTSVLARKLVTGSKYDVQFKDLNARYPFGFAAFW